MKVLNSKLFVRAVAVVILIGAVDGIARIIQGIIWLINKI